MEKKINITSTLVEKSIDAASKFLGTLLNPVLKETGLFLADQVSHWRFKNQVRMLIKAKAVCEQNNISTKAISAKLLYPLLEQSSLEEDEFLQDKWANLLANLVDSEQNIQNHVFPYILSQLSKEEMQFLDESCSRYHERIARLQEELEEYPKVKDQVANNLKHQIEDMEKMIKESNGSCSMDDFRKVGDLRSELLSWERRPEHIEIELASKEVLAVDTIQEYEISNLMRLGLIKEEVDSDFETEKIGSDYTRMGYHGYHRVVTNVITFKEFVLTQLCLVFINACTEKKEQQMSSLVLPNA